MVLCSSRIAMLPTCSLNCVLLHRTTLLDVLATRVTMGVVTGEMLVDGRQRDNSFQRKTGYVSLCVY